MKMPTTSAFDDQTKIGWNSNHIPSSHMKSLAIQKHSSEIKSKTVKKKKEGIKTEARVQCI